MIYVNNKKERRKNVESFKSGKEGKGYEKRNMILKKKSEKLCVPYTLDPFDPNRD